MTRLDDIKARVAAATPGPWAVSDWGDGVFTVDVETDEGRAFLALTEADYLHIAHARTDIPDLLRVAEAAVAVVEMTKRVAAELLAKAEAEGVVIDDETRSALLEGNEPGHPITILAAALAPLLADR